MTRTPRWDPCVSHLSAEAGEFIDDYFSGDHIMPLLIAGSGFDPRSQIVASRLANACSNLQAVLIKEIRPNPSKDQVDQADINFGGLTKKVSKHELLQIEIFGEASAVVGGRNVVNALNDFDFSGITDIVVDVSALSVGTSFPIIKLFEERIGRNLGPTNLHVFVVHDPGIDQDITMIANDVPGYIHGFRGGQTLESAANAAKLWLPQLSPGRRTALEYLHKFVRPDDTCPIVPFPSADPRIADRLLAEYIEELEKSWKVDPRSIVYADESDPIDLYRTILKLDDLRRPVFKEYGGSHLVLSPLGSKVMALGALMAALERDLPIAYIEAETYTLGPKAKVECDDPCLIHIWLEGDAYPDRGAEKHLGEN